MERTAIQRFRILGHLGAGGTGSVYRAHDPALEREVAIKVLSAPASDVRSELSSVRTIDLRGDDAPPSANALLREARILARLSHPNVVAVYEVGLDGDNVFVVMELVDGTDLRRWLTGRTTPEILEVFAQAARGLEAAHARGIVHRDVKPENVLIGRDGRVRVVDFGLSRLVSVSSLMSVADRGGTPRYMAPELWAGAVTPAADVYAMCMAIAEAFDCDPRDPDVDVVATLRARGVPPVVCDVIAAGLAPEPVRRPSISRIAAALARSPSRARAIAIGAAAAALGAIGLVLGSSLLAGDPEAPACADDARALEGRWDDAMREQLRATLAAAGSGASAEDVRRTLGVADDRARGLVAAQRQVCEAAARDEITAAQAAQRTSCVERRAMEIGASVRSADALQRRRPGLLEERLLAVTPATCAGLELPPLGDRAAVERLYTRYAILDNGAAGTTSEAAAIAEAAAALGDAELEVRAEISLGVAQRDANKLAESTATLERAYQHARAIRSEEQQAIALTERSLNAGRTGDQREAKLLAQLAHDLLDKPTVPVRTRFRVLRSLGRAELVRGEYAAAIERLRAALAILDRSGERYAYLEILARMDLTDALLNVRPPEGLTLAVETAERAKALLGERSQVTAQAVNQVGKAYMHRGEPARSLVYRRQALAILAPMLPPDNALLLHQRAEVAETLHALGDADAARDELTAIVARAESNAGVRMWRTHWQTLLAEATYNSGRHDEGLARYATVVDQSVSELGADHDATLTRRLALAELQIDADRLADAANTAAALERVCMTNTDPIAKHWLARVRGELVAKLALLRGRAREAEATSRLALAALAEDGVGEAERVPSRLVLAASLVEQRKHAEARRLLEELVALARAEHLSDDLVATIDLVLAQTEYGLGLRDAALARAERVRDVLARYRGRARAGRDVAALLATIGRTSDGAGHAGSSRSASGDSVSRRRP